MLFTSSVLRQLGSRMRSLRSDESGTVGIIFGATLAATMTMLGVTVDYSSAVNAKTLLQSAVDEAVMAAVRSPEGTSAASQNAAVIARIQANLLNTGITYTGCECGPGTDGSYTARATGSIRTSALQLTGIRTLPISATATGSTAMGSPLVPQKVTFQMTSAYGHYWKRIRLFRINSSNETEQMAEWVYQPRNQSAENNRGTGNISGPTDSIDLGTSYKKIYLTMEVVSGPCGPTQTTSRRSTPANIICTNSSTTAASYTFRTDDPTTANHLKVNGVFLTSSQVTNLYQIMPCGSSPLVTTHDWEDSDAAFGAEQWSTQDVFMSITTNTCAMNENFKLPTTRLKR